MLETCQMKKSLISASEKMFTYTAYRNITKNYIDKTSIQNEVS